MRVLVAVLILLPVLAACSPFARETQDRISGLKKQLPLGSSLLQAEKVLTTENFPYTTFSSQRCEENVKYTTPTYTPKGGPCTFALVKVGQTWWGYVVDIQVRLFFDSKNTLVAYDFDRIDTFL